MRMGMFVFKGTLCLVVLKGTKRKTHHFGGVPDSTGWVTGESRGKHLIWCFGAVSFTCSCILLTYKNNPPPMVPMVLKGNLEENPPSWQIPY